MAFKKLLHYLYDAQVIIKWNHAPLNSKTLNSKVNNLRTEIAGMSHVKF